MHLGTAIALLIYFWRDWFDFGMAVLFNQGARPAEERRLFWRVGGGNRSRCDPGRRAREDPATCLRPRRKSPAAS